MRIKLIALFVTILFTLTACSTNNEQKEDESLNNQEKEISYNVLSPDWPVYETTEKLVEAGKIITIGKVTNVSFEMLDTKTAQPPTEASDKKDCHIHTIYYVEIITSYKGNTSETLKVRMLGGKKGNRLQEQLAALGEGTVIDIVDGMPDLEIGKEYLFVLYQREENAMPTLISLDQGVYSVEKPLTKDEYSYTSSKEIISSFGKEKWDEFQKSGLEMKE